MRNMKGLGRKILRLEEQVDGSWYVYYADGTYEQIDITNIQRIQQILDYMLGLTDSLPQQTEQTDSKHDKRS